MDTQPGELRVSRMIDFKIPLWSILSAFFFLALLIGGMYFQLNRLSEDMADLKITVKAGNTSTTTVQGELAILRFRVETLEAERRAAAAARPVIPGGTR
jgi:fumarate reductase subunit D